ncbi:MAG: class I SAM-dependent rRNA methyltransferase [Elusimicrobia bacterium]|nr:class I SAM-dependent rRNA methyltransferase [Elusimicrobiota bacterium]
MASHPAPPKAPAGHSLPIPWVRLRSAASGPRVFKRMILDAAPGAKAGDIVAVYDKSDAPYGVAMYNPRNVVALRLLARGVGDFDAEKFFTQKIAQAVEFRREVLRLDEATDACRLVHDQGDGLPGLVIDRYGDFLVLEFYSLGMFRQAALLERILKQHFPAARFVRRASEHSQSMEGFRIPPGPAFKTRIKENEVLFEVTPSEGYKTGFFCDQRDNRLAAAALARDRSVLDVCAYTGGFGLYAAKLGGARETACVELDPEAHALIRKNANVNGVRIDAVCADAFPYLRQMAANGRRYGFIVLDPYKLIASKEGERLGRQKYLDLNRLAFSLLDSGGILLTCSCSGLLPWADFQQIVRTAAGSAGRRVQIFRKSGAGADHPFAVDFPEGEYLKALWCRAA